VNDDLVNFELWFQVCSDGIELRRINYDDQDRLLYFSYNSYVGMCMRERAVPLSRDVFISMLNEAIQAKSWPYFGEVKISTPV